MKIVLAVTSSIAAYKACDLLRLYINDGHDVHVIMSENTVNLVGPLTFETLSGNPVSSSMWHDRVHTMTHIALREEAALFVVAPATANSIGKMANGIADDLVSTTFIAMECPIAVAPAMNPAMWKNKAVQENIEILKRRGITVIEPEHGQVACQDIGTGRLADVSTIFKKTTTLI